MLHVLEAVHLPKKYFVLNYDKVNDTMHQTKSSFKKFKSDFIEANSQKKNSPLMSDLPQKVRIYL